MPPLYRISLSVSIHARPHPSLAKTETYLGNSAGCSHRCRACFEAVHRGCSGVFAQIVPFFVGSSDGLNGGTAMHQSLTLSSRPSKKASTASAEGCGLSVLSAVMFVSWP